MSHYSWNLKTRGNLADELTLITADQTKDRLKGRCSLLMTCCTERIQEPVKQRGFSFMLPVAFC